MTEKHKPVIETMINTAALALTSFGVLTITSSNGDLTYACIAKGLILIAFGAGLEYFKYLGRFKNLW